MRRICAICGKKEGTLLASALLLQIDNVCYCKQCYTKQFGGLPAHPMPDEMFPGPMKSVNHTLLSNCEIKFEYTHFKTETKVHILMYHTQRGDYPHHVMDKFIGIDRYSGKLVYVDYDDDWEYSRGVSAQYLTDDQFFSILQTYPKQIREVFTAYSGKNWENFLDVYVPMDTSTASHLIVKEYGTCAKVAYISDSWGWFYAEVPIAQYKAWKAGKRSLDCIATLKDLLPGATKHSPCSNKRSEFALSIYLPRMKLFQPVKRGLEACIKAGAPASTETANFIYTQRQSRQISEFSVPDELIEPLLAYMERNLNIQ